MSRDFACFSTSDSVMNADGAILAASAIILVPQTVSQRCDMALAAVIAHYHRFCRYGASSIFEFVVLGSYEGLGLPYIAD